MKFEGGAGGSTVYKGKKTHCQVISKLNYCKPVTIQNLFQFKFAV